MDDNVKALDLSQLPKITPSSGDEIQLETEKRSYGLTVIQDLAEQLTKAMAAYLTDLKDMDAQAKRLEQQKFELVEIEKELRYQRNVLEEKERNIKTQMAYIETSNTEANQVI